MDIEKINKKILEVIKNEEFKLYSVEVKKEFGMKILEVKLNGKNINSDILSRANEMIIDVINDDLDDSFYLEVSSAGAERPLTGIEDIIDNVGKYINISSNEYTGNATLLSVNDDVIVIEVNLKGRMKKINIGITKIAKIRLAVKV